MSFNLADRSQIPGLLAIRKPLSKKEESAVNFMNEISSVGDISMEAAEVPCERIGIYARNSVSSLSPVSVSMVPESPTFDVLQTEDFLKGVMEQDYDMSSVAPAKVSSEKECADLKGSRSEDYMGVVISDSSPSKLLETTPIIRKKKFNRPCIAVRWFAIVRLKFAHLRKYQNQKKRREKNKDSNYVHGRPPLITCSSSKSSPSLGDLFVVVGASNVSFSSYVCFTKNNNRLLKYFEVREDKYNAENMEEIRKMPSLRLERNEEEAIENFRQDLLEEKEDYK